MGNGESSRASCPDFDPQFSVRETPLYRFPIPNFRFPPVQNEPVVLKSAITMLKTIVANDSRNADALNLLGFSLRKSGDMKNAEGFYLKALKLNPRHKGAHEYLGELYVETGHMDKAKAQLATLAKLCGNTTCEEYKDLKKAISAAG